MNYAESVTGLYSLVNRKIVFEIISTVRKAGHDKEGMRGGARHRRAPPRGQAAARNRRAKGIPVLLGEPWFGWSLSRSWACLAPPGLLGEGTRLFCVPRVSTLG